MSDTSVSNSETPDLTPGASVPYTHGHADAVLRSHRWRTAENSAAYLLGRLQPGMSLLDVGSGPGTLTVDLAKRVAPGLTVGVDLEPAVVAEAAALADGSGVDVTFVAGDVAGIDAPAGGFDVVHAHQVLQHVGDPVGVLRTMASLTADGGTVAARDADYPAMTWWPHEPLLDRWMAIYLEVARRNGANPDGGRQLLSWAQEAGLTDITYSTSTWTYCTEADLGWWTQLWSERITGTRLADQAVAYGLSTREELAAISTAWLEWGTRPGAVFVVLNGEVMGSPVR